MNISASARPAAVAGVFYPADAMELADTVEGYIEQAPAGDGPVPKAIIAPHAGYVYSGPTAAAAYRRLLPARDTIRRVVLVGPSHRVPLMGLATCDWESYATPLGEIPIDRDAVGDIAGLPQVQVLDAAHRLEHSLEVHLPFLQCVLNDFQLVPIVAGNASGREVGEVLDRLWGGPETLIVISSDLSHYLDYDSARAADRETTAAIASISATPIEPEQACGCIGINGLLHVARHRGLHCDVLDLRNSGDTAGPRERVVGYGAYGFFTDEAGPGIAADEDAPHLSEDERSKLLGIARQAIEARLAGHEPPPIVLADLPPALAATGASFVTLTIDGNLRGCIGSLEAERPLAEDVARNAAAAAFRDPRFSPLQQDEFGRVDTHISVLTPATPMHIESEQDLVRQLRPGKDGLIIRQGPHRATFLPSVWEQLPDPQTFVTHLKHKAGIMSHGTDELQAWRYTTEQFPD